jgi:16S rRNA (uracil1498-N3)-methyltransferase
LAKALDGWDASRPLIFADEAGDDAAAAWGGERGRVHPISEALQALRPSPQRGEGREGGRTTGRHASHVTAEMRARENDSDSSARPLPLPPPQGAGGLALLIGPEGGFTTEERRLLRSLPYVIPVSLGPRILRAETAVIAGLSVIQSVWGDWREP